MKGQQAYFRSSCVLSFPLLSDDGTVSTAYGVLEQIPFEDEAPGVRRAARHSFLIGPDGKVALHWQARDPATHAGEVLAEVRERLEAELA